MSTVKVEITGVVHHVPIRKGLSLHTNIPPERLNRSGPSDSPEGTVSVTNPQERDIVLRYGEHHDLWGKIFKDDEWQNWDPPAYGISKVILGPPYGISYIVFPDKEMRVQKDE